MSITHLGDAAQFHRLRQDGTRLRSDLQRLTSELSSGTHADPGRALGGDFSALSDVTRRLALTRSFSDGIAQAALEAQARQAALGQVEAEVTGVAPQLLAIAASGNLADLTLANAATPDRFAQAVSVLNTRVAGQSLFAGDAPDRAALQPAAEIMDTLRGLAVTATSPEDLMQEIEAWFMDGDGGFATVAWQGGAEAAAPVVIGEGKQTDTALTALEPSIRRSLAGLALGSLVAEGAVSFGEAATREVIETAANWLLRGEASLIELRADLGLSQGRLEAAQVEVAATRAGLEIEQTRLSEVDPYRTATEIEALQTRLESLYILTARLSRLSLSEYLR